MFSKVVNLLRTFGGQIMVGVDKNGNSYYRKIEKIGGGWEEMGFAGILANCGSHAAEKRWVEFKGTPDPNRIPVEWTSWLSGTRKHAPTPQELIDLEAQRKNVKLQTALLQKEDEKRRFRVMASQQGHRADEGRPEDMEIIMRQIGSGEFGSSQPGKAKAEEPSHARYTKVRDVKESAEPTTWQPPRKTSRTTSGGSKSSEDSSATRSTQPQGQGDEFQPGTWRP